MRAAQAQTTKPTWCMNMMQIHVDRNMSLVTASQACTPRFSDATHIVLFGWCFTVITNSDQNAPGREKVHKINNLKAFKCFHYKVISSCTRRQTHSARPEE